MKLFEGKSPKERNQIIALIVIGSLAVVAVAYNLSGLFRGKTKSPATASASPTPTGQVQPAPRNPGMPAQSEMDFEYQTTKIEYNPRAFAAPDPGRNIFAFYEPPRPTPYSPTPTPPPTPFPTPSPTPTPPILATFLTPQSVYAGSRGFRLQLSGDKLTSDSVILFNGNQLPTAYLGPQALAADIPANLIASAGPRDVTVITPGGKWSNRLSLNVMEPPRPQVKYIGMVGRKRYNNDTAYFEESGKPLPISARLNDIIGGRFRLKSISPEEVVFEDVNLGFTYPIKMERPAPGSATLTGTQPRPPDNNEFLNSPVDMNDLPAGAIPGIPSNIPRYRPTPRPSQQDEPDKPDDDGTDDGKPR